MINLDAKLTPREQEVAEYIGFGYSIKETAWYLGIAFDTVRVTMVKIYRKLGIQKATELSKYVYCRRFHLSLSECEPFRRIGAMVLVCLFVYSMYMESNTNFLRLREREGERVERVVRRKI
jgi:DNA-binding CsgD family transcriptional regulator